MRKMIYGYLALCGVGVCTNVALAAGSKISALECVPHTILMCEVSKTTCEPVPVTDIEGRHVIKVDLQKKSYQTYQGSQRVVTGAISRIERQQALIIMSGYRDQFHDSKHPYGWNAVIDSQTGQLTVTSVANGLGFMLSGVCKQSRGN